MLQPLFESPAPAPGCGETPYLKLLSQLFGDRMLVANATGCSSIYGGNLPTTPWASDSRGARAGLVELAVRGQRRVRPGDAARPRPAGVRRAAARVAWLEPGLVARGVLDADQTTRRGSPPSASASRSSRRLPRAGAGGDARPSLQSPTRWSARASGSSAATAGRTTSASAGSTTCSPPGATSTSWCSTPRSTPTRAARPRRRPRAAPWPSSPPAASVGRRTWADRRGYGNVYVAQVAMGADTLRPSRLRRGRVLPRPLARHRLQPLHRPRDRHDDGDGAPERGRRRAATGRCTATTPGYGRGGSTRSTSTAAPTLPVSTEFGEGGSLRHARRAIPAEASPSFAARAGGRRRALAPLRADGGDRAQAPARCADGTAAAEHGGGQRHDVDLERPTSA